MQKVILSLFLGVLSGLTNSFGAWGPTPSPYTPPHAAYHGYEYGAQQSSSFQGPFTGNVLSSSCSVFKCGSLRGFRGCLASPQSIYRFYAHNRHRAQSAKARDARMRFIYAFPDCFKTFCRNVCIQPQPEKSTSSRKRAERTLASKSDGSRRDFNDEDALSSEESFSESDDESLSDSDEGSDTMEGSSVSEESSPNRKSRTRGLFNRLRGSGKWVRSRYQDFQKSRSETKRARLRRATTLCRERSAEGYELRAFCSECVAYIASHQELNPACRLTPKEIAALDREDRRTAQTRSRVSSQQRHTRPSRGRHSTTRSRRPSYTSYDNLSDESYGERSGYNRPYGLARRRPTPRDRFYEGRSVGYEEASLNYYPSRHQGRSPENRQFQDSMPADTHLDGLSDSGGSSGSATTEASRSHSGTSRSRETKGGSGATRSSAPSSGNSDESIFYAESANAESLWRQSDVSR